MNSRPGLQFYKYQGTGNDFIMVDNRPGHFPKTDLDGIRLLCDRRLGIGADGLILLENDKLSDFRMVYYNSDGNESTMCGNGGRCIVAFAKALGIIEEKTSFLAIDGLHQAEIDGDYVTLRMIDVAIIEDNGTHFFLDTGSPHHVQLVEDLEQLDVQTEGAKLRYGLYGQEGSNINFVTQLEASTFEVRTYERGVENETLSCGTGVTAVALAMNSGGKTTEKDIIIKTKGGDLRVQFEKGEKGYTQVLLSGSATLVFKGETIC